MEVSKGKKLYGKERICLLNVRRAMTTAMYKPRCLCVAVLVVVGDVMCCDTVCDATWLVARWNAVMWLVVGCEMYCRVTSCHVM